MNPPRSALSLLAAWALCSLASAVAAPTVTNVRAAQRLGTKLVDIHYDLANPGGAGVNVRITVSSDGGNTYSVPAAAFTGAFGAGVTPGINKYVVWDAGIDWNGRFTDRGRVRVSAEDGLRPAAGMAYIPGGHFQMGENSSPRSILVSDFWIDRFEVSYELWNQVMQWGVARGYIFGKSGLGVAPDHPVHTVSWFSSVVWCNARSEMEGLIPAYYTDAAHSRIYRGGEVNLSLGMVKWTANGYRLPTEAEWEKAARGGLTARDYPWGNTVDGSDANYWSSGDPFEGANIRTTPVGYYNGRQTPAGVDMANGYGLYDMAGNVWEWCWDWYGNYPAGPQTDPRGPDTGSYRVLRGGSWDNRTDNLRCANRNNNAPSRSRLAAMNRCA